MIGKLRNSQNEKLGSDCERRSEKMKAEERKKTGEDEALRKLK